MKKESPAPLAPLPPPNTPSTPLASAPVAASVPPSPGGEGRDEGGGKPDSGPPTDKAETKPVELPELALVRGKVNLCEFPRGVRVVIEKGRLGVVELSRLEALAGQVETVKGRPESEQDLADVEALTKLFPQ